MTNIITFQMAGKLFDEIEHRSTDPSMSAELQEAVDQIFETLEYIKRGRGYTAQFKCTQQQFGLIVDQMLIGTLNILECEWEVEKGTKWRNEVAPLMRGLVKIIEKAGA